MRERAVAFWQICTKAFQLRSDQVSQESKDEGRSSYAVMSSTGNLGRTLPLPALLTGSASTVNILVYLHGLGAFSMCRGNESSVKVYGLKSV